MPQPHGSDPQTGWIGAAIGGGIATVVAGIFALFKSWMERSTALRIKESDHGDKQMDAITLELTNLRSISSMQQNTIAEMLNHRDAQGQLMQSRSEEVSHLKNEMERMQIKIEKLEARESEYEKVIKKKDVLIAEQVAIIQDLQERVSSFDHIGVGEAAPPKRLKEVET